MDEVQIQVTAADFNRLWNTHTTWGYGWSDQLAKGRFETVNGEMSTKWKHAYWLGDNYTVAILARSWLHRQNYAVIWDKACCEYVLLTDYNWNWRNDASAEAREHRT
jgi:hypothetical protein